MSFSIARLHKFLRRYTMYSVPFQLIGDTTIIGLQGLDVDGHKT